MAGQIEHDAAGQLLQTHRAQVADRPQHVLLKVSEEERPVPALEAVLVVVQDRRRGGAAHGSLSAARGCLGRRRYIVFGTSTFGGLAGVGLRTFVWIGFRRFTPPVYPRLPAQYGAPGNVLIPAWRPAARYIFTPPTLAPPHSSFPTPSWSAQLRPRTVRAASAKPKAEAPSRSPPRAPPTGEPRSISSITSRPIR